jgi:protein-S-isoprenylcysteine O-methyltransferase Ste14
VVVVLALLAAGAICIDLSYRYGLVLPPSPLFPAVGAVFLAGGFVLRLLAAREIRCTQQIETLVTSGVYARTRNPIYLAFILIMVGLACLSRAWLSIAWVVAAILVFYWLARQEEADLVAAFGEAYEKYRTEVPLFLPRIG